MTRTRLVLAGVALVALGSTTTYLIMKRLEPTQSMADPGFNSTANRPPAAQDPPSSSADTGVTLSKEAVARGGIIIGQAAAASESGELRIPAVVEPNAYRSVVVTPIVAGRVTSVTAELGQTVRRGQDLAQLYSPELAEAQSRYLASRAELDAHERELRRTERLAEIGSASRQELERVHAEHTAATTMVQSLRSRLTLLGMTSGQIDTLSEITATAAIPAPIDGVITARTANTGLNADPATQLFTVVDLSTVWLVGDIYERDFARVRIGNAVSVTTTAFPGLTLEGKVSYIDPVINQGSRTARIRVEVPNAGRQLRIGMYAEMSVKEMGESRESAVSSRVVVPRAAVQIVGNRSVVYLADAKEPGRFAEREVQLGRVSGENVEVISGLRIGDPVVVGGSFSLRAERERLGLAPTRPTVPPMPAAVQPMRIVVSDEGFEPARVRVRSGVPLRLTFVRTSDATCATGITIPAMKIERALPLNQPVDIDLTPQKTGEIEFLCGANMLRGSIVVQ